MKRLFVLIPLMALLAGCAVVTPRTFERVVADAEANGDKYTEEDWQNADRMFEQFSDRYDYSRLADLSEQEQREVGRLTARYVKVRARAAMGDVNKTLKAGVSVMRGFIEGLGLNLSDSPLPTDPDEQQ